MKAQVIKSYLFWVEVGNATLGNMSVEIEKYPLSQGKGALLHRQTGMYVSIDNK